MIRIKEPPIVYHVDEDDGTSQVVRQLTATMNLRCQAFASGREFLDAFEDDRCGCVVTELKVPEVNGLQIQQYLAAEGANLPVIFLTAHGTVPLAVRALRAGAFHFLQKPVHQQELWDAIQDAVELDEQRREAAERAEQLRKRLGKLTMKEEQVLYLLGEAKPTRKIAKELELSVRTIEVRRNQIMRKLGFKSPDELIRFAMNVRNGHTNGNGNGHLKRALVASS